MNRKKLWIVLLPLFLLLVAAVLVGAGAVSGNHMVASTPVYNNPDVENPTVETITDETTPLAGTQPVQPLDIESVVVRVYAPRAADPASEQIPFVSGIVPAPAVEEPAPVVPAPEAPAPVSPAPETPVTEYPAPEEPAPASTTATRMLDRAYTLIAQFNASANSAEKRALLGISNNNFSNDSFRQKILADMGGSFEQLEAEVVDSTQYQQDKTLYVQVYIAGKSTAYEPVVYSTQNSGLLGSQWSTNLVYDDNTATWMEYTQKHEFNDSRVGYSLAKMNGQEGAADALKDTMETSDLWQPVEVTPDTEAPVESKDAGTVE